MTVISSIDVKKLCTIFSASIGRIKYKLGVKPLLNAKVQNIEHSDCSGFVRWLLYQASDGKIKIGLGSWYQQKWCQEQGFKKTDYSQSAPLKDNRLRIAFINQHGSEAGHVWLVFNGWTKECFGGYGVGTRRWNASIDGGKSSLDKAVSACYVLTEALR